MKGIARIRHECSLPAGFPSGLVVAEATVKQAAGM
jgi:hypothetical protein